MSVSLPGVVVERRVVHRPTSSVAARARLRPDGTVCLVVNDVVRDVTGGTVVLEMWARFVLIKRTRFSVLSLEHLRLSAPTLDGQHFDEAICLGD